jgi:hypothetical protein
MVSVRPATIGLMLCALPYFILDFIRVVMICVYSFMATAYFLHTLMIAWFLLRLLMLESVLVALEKEFILTSP